MGLIARREERCRECHQRRGDWHVSDCGLGSRGPGRVDDVDVEVLEFVSLTTYQGAVDDARRLREQADEAYRSLHAGRTVEALEYLRLMRQPLGGR